MLTLRKSEDRGHVRESWLETYHTFSFDTYHDPAHMGFRTLRVINEDRVAPGRGFPLHPHRDMEILTFIIEGALQHRDDTGGEGIIRAGEVQRMSAGTGVRHGERNPSDSEPVHLLQIWILPERKGLPPSYETRSFAGDRRNRLQLIASRDGADGSAVIHQEVRLYAGEFDAGQTAEYPLAPGRHAWVQVVHGSLDLNGTPLRPGDGAAVSDERQLRLRIGEKALLVLFDLG